MNLSHPIDKRQISAGWPVFDEGNYAAAYIEAEGAGDAREALAMVMCGAVGPGLAKLTESEQRDSAVSLYAAFAQWCLGECEAAVDLLAEYKDAEPATRLSAAITAQKLDVVLIAAPGSDKVSAFKAAAGFRIFSFELDADEFGVEMVDLLARLPDDANPIMIISVDAHGVYLPRNFGDVGIPAVLWCSDHDYFLATRHDDFEQASVVVVNSGDEQREISKTYPVRAASFPGHESYRTPERSGTGGKEGKYDILFTGRAFVPYMTDKARYLAQMATEISPDREIALVDDYLGEEAYPAILDDARYVPIYWRYKGGVQTRAIEALGKGTSIISPEITNCGGLLGGESGGFFAADEQDPATVVQGLLDGDDAEREPYDDQYRGLFWSSPAREERFLKFAFLQTILAGQDQPQGSSSTATPVELRGYGVENGLRIYSRIAQVNLAAADKSAAHFNYAGSAAFYAAILAQTRNDLGVMALEAFTLGRAAYPRSLVLAFNGARALWMFGQRDPAIAIFDEIAGNDDWEFQPATEAMLSHRVRALADMFPYGEYHRSVATALSESGRNLEDAQNFVLSSVCCYLGVAHSDAAYLREATTTAPENFVAWRELAKCLAGQEGEASEIGDALSRSVNLYPPVLLDLLTVGVNAAEKLDRPGAAAELVRRWLLLAYRRKDREFKPKLVSTEALATAKRYRESLGAWSGDMLDALTAANEQSKGGSS